MSPNVLATSRGETALNSTPSRNGSPSSAAAAGVAGVRKCGSDLLQILFDSIGTTCLTQEPVMERQAVFGLEAVRIGSEKGRKLAFGRCGDRNFLGQKLHLLPHRRRMTASSAVKSGCPSRAVEDFVPDIVFDQVLQFLLARRAPPRPRKSIGKVRDLRRRKQQSFPVPLRLAYPRESRG